MFELGENEMEFGLGIHGEPGYERSHYRSAKEVADLLLRKLQNSEKLSLKKGQLIILDYIAFSYLWAMNFSKLSWR